MGWDGDANLYFGSSSLINLQARTIGGVIYQLRFLTKAEGFEKLVENECLKE